MKKNYYIYMESDNQISHDITECIKKVIHDWSCFSIYKSLKGIENIYLDTHQNAHKSHKDIANYLKNTQRLCI